MIVTDEPANMQCDESVLFFKSEILKYTTFSFRISALYRLLFLKSVHSKLIKRSTLFPVEFVIQFSLICASLLSYYDSSNIPQGRLDYTKKNKYITVTHISFSIVLEVHGST